MKLKITKQEEVETDIDLPVYLYFQDELGYEEYVEITDNQRISIKNDFFGTTISVENVFSVYNFNPKNLISKELFYEEFNLVKQRLNMNESNKYIVRTLLLGSLGISYQFFLLESDLTKDQVVEKILSSFKCIEGNELYGTSDYFGDDVFNKNIKVMTYEEYVCQRINKTIQL